MMTEQVQEAFELGFMAGQLPSQQEAYTWCVLYKNDALLHEVDAERGFASVKHDDVKLLTLLPLQGGISPHHMPIPPDATPVFFRRRSIELHPLQGETGNRATTHCIGWKRGDEAIYLFCFDDGSTLLTSDLQAV